ncbi:DUF429 domain-containing protein [Gordonia sp. LSe1-13]|uniref:DUF429 domain-containing protein n=1 Tax=Gordonia sesuvii TaxID=3116777 RepID=A0ABU7MGF2_9ACTN|nr:DUF429 domain-containing protein [Gordonia sp. LSe1-13]
MRTVGIDLAASPARTAVAVVDWSTGAARLTDLVMPADDARIVDLTAGADRIGIDAPFGWPDDFVDLVVAQHRGQLGPGRGLDDIEQRRPLAYRRTDRHVMSAKLGNPLSVSADQIAHVAFRCVGLLADLGVSDRVDGRAVEAYPAAALRHWGLTHRSYKGPARRSVLAASYQDLVERAPWFDVAGHRELLVTDDNAFDAVVTAFIARAAALGRTTLPDDGDRPIALREGWIHVPDCALAELV